MDSRELLYFCTIVEQNSISRAAEKLNITQPPLSTTLKRLEEKLGVSLIVRTTRQWRITNEGQQLYIKGKKILSELDDLKNAIRENTISGEVKIGICARCLSFYTSVVSIIEKALPNVTCRVLVIDTPSIENSLKKWDIDFALILRSMDESGYHIIPLPAQHYVAMFSNLLPAPPEGPIGIYNLAKYPLLVTRRWYSMDGARPLMNYFSSLGLKPRVIMDTQASYILPDLLYTTPAVAILLDTEIPEIYKKAFPIRKIDVNLEQYPSIVYLDNVHMSSQSVAVMNIIQRQADNIKN